MEDNDEKSTPNTFPLDCVQVPVDFLTVSTSLSLPISDDNKNDKSEEISEHISPNSDSFENDRSYQEIEVSHGQNVSCLDPVHDVEEKTYALDTSLHSENSIISLNYLQNIEDEYVRNILEGIFQPDPVHSEKEATVSSKEESFNIFANLDLNDGNLSNTRNITEMSLDEKNLYATNFGLVSNDSELSKRIKDFEELICIKDSTIAALTSELDSIKESSNVNTGSTLSTTEYKQLQDEWHSKFVEFNNAITYKDELIQQLTESLDQSVKKRKDMLQQIEELKNEVAELQLKIKDEANIKSNETTKSNFLENINEKLAKEYLTLNKTLDTKQQTLLLELNLKFYEILKENKNNFEMEIKQLKDNRDTEKEDFESEITRLTNLLDKFKSGSSHLMDLKNDMDVKHSQEMEELRTYFEKKCAELEKNYSEEVFSQHSRKMSSSSCSEAELNSDLQFLHPPGPEGDGLHDLSPNLNKKDVINLQNELNSIINKISKCDLDTMNDEDFSNLKIEIGRSNLRNLLKYDVPVVRNKHHKSADTEDFKKDSDDIKDQYEDKLKLIKEKYEEEIGSLRNLLENLEKQHVCISSAVQEVGSSGEFEINEVIQSYERRLQEQVTLAKLDIISALEMQIQRLAANEADDEEWPSELLKLKDRFKEKYETQLQDLKEEHQIEIDKLKEEHHKMLNGALERARRRSLRDGDSFNKSEIEILKERDSLKRQVSSLRNLLGELLKYFTQCEDELNNTLVDELLKHNFDKNLSQTEEELNLTNSSPTSSSKTSDSTLNITRVHLTPNFSDLISIIENSSNEDDSKDISIDLKNELGVCLDKLKHEANAILTLTNNIAKQTGNDDEAKYTVLEEQLNSLTRKLISENQAKEELKDELKENQMYVESLERERDRLDEELERIITKANALEEDLNIAKNKIAQFLESGRKEIVSEGYGEEGLHLQSLGDTMKILSDLQERARSVLLQSRTSADPTLLHLIEELCRVGERIKEESKKDRYDLLQQIDAADKKYRTTEKFLEEQAMEREQERDEAQKKIDDLYDQLKERDKDKINYERVTSEVNGVCNKATHRFTLLQVEHLEHQLQEKNSALTAASQKIKELETARSEAIEKISVLNDVIIDLEHQTNLKSKEIQQYLEVVKRLQCIVDQQERVSDIPTGDSTRDVSDVGELYRHIDHLENELQKLRLQSELAGNEGPSKQIRTQLYEIESQVDRKTKELETLHSTTGTNCSSPSEDVSARELVLPRSPKKMEECEVPLQQLARLREKLVRHSRAEDAAMKRIRDLEMQVFGVKQELEETINEREYMKKQIQEQLVLISDFQIRLDEQRIRADNIEKQTNTSLEIKIYDLQNEITSLREKLQQKEKTISNQQVLLAETQDRLKNLENDVSSSKDDELIVSMQTEIDRLRAKNAEMRIKLQNDASMVPNLVENIISDKNSDMERLRLRLDDTEKLLEEYTSLKIDKKDLQTIANFKNNGTSLEELFSILDLSRPDQVRRMERTVSFDSPGIFIQNKKFEDTLEPEISAIAGPAASNSAIQTRNSTEISHKKVHFEDINVESLRNEIDNLKKLVESKDSIIADYEERLKLLNNLETKIEKLQASLEETEKTLAAASETFEKEQNELKEREKDLGVQLAEKKLQLEEKQKQLKVLEQDSRRKDEMYKNLTKEKKQLEKEITSLKHDNYKNVDNAIRVKNKEIDDLTLQLSSKASVEADRFKKQITEKNDEISSLLKEIDTLTIDLGESHSKNKILEESLQKRDSEIIKLNKELDNKMTQIETITEEMSNVKEKLNKKRKNLREFQDTIDSQKKILELIQDDQKNQKSIILNKDAAIDILNEDINRYQAELLILETDIQELKKDDTSKLKKQLEEKESKIEELNKERNHMWDLINEKEKIINQMAEDSHQLHMNLVTIKSKINEPGNIIDLGNRLKDEQRKTSELVLEIHNLKAQLMHYKNNDMTTSVDEIANQLKKELDNSIKIDSNILNAVSDQSLSSISEIQDMEAYKKALSKEKTNKKQLLQHVHKLQAKIAELQDDLEKERAALLQTRTEDAQCIQQLRIQLDSYLDNEEALRNMLTNKNTKNEQLEKELDLLKKKNVSVASKSESTEYKQLPSINAAELTKLRKEFDAIQDEKNQLIKEVSSLKQAKLEAETGYRCTKDLLAQEIQRKKSLEEKVQSLLTREKELKDCLMQKNLEMERVVDDMSQEKADLIKQKLELLQRIKSQNPFTIQPLAPVTTNSVTDEVLDKIKELNNALIDNKKLMDLIARISNEKKQLEIQLDTSKDANKSTNVQMPTNDLIARADYLFAKTLKLESIRKALVFQKRYLMQYLISHKKDCPVSILPDPVVQRIQFTRDYTLKHRFRAVSFVIISVIRMKYLVRRWHSGVRIAEKINSRHYKNPSILRKTSTAPVGFQVGQPVSNQFFSNLPPAVAPSRNLNPFIKNENIEEERSSFRGEEEGGPSVGEGLLRRVPWSGNTPPSKERRNRIIVGPNVLNKEDMTPLKAPQLLAQFAERFDQIQGKLDGVFESNSS